MMNGCPQRCTRHDYRRFMTKKKKTRRLLQAMVGSPTSPLWGSLSMRIFRVDTQLPSTQFSWCPCLGFAAVCLTEDCSLSSLSRYENRKAIKPRATGARHTTNGVSSRGYQSMPTSPLVWPQPPGRGGNSRFSSMCIPKQRRLATQARQDLHPIDPETRPHKETTNILATTDIWIKR